MRRKKKQIIGRVEKVDFPDLNIFSINAKIDTGAFTSALHYKDIYQEVNAKSEKKLVIIFHHTRQKGAKQQMVIFDRFSRAKVRSSTGHSDMRYKIKTRVKLGRQIFITEFTLTDRSDMRYPVLLGRKALKNRFLVNVAKAFCHNK